MLIVQNQITWGFQWRRVFVAFFCPTSKHCIGTWLAGTHFQFHLLAATFIEFLTHHDRSIIRQTLKCTIILNYLTPKEHGSLISVLFCIVNYSHKSKAISYIYIIKINSDGEWWRKQHAGFWFYCIHRITENEKYNLI